MGNFQRDKKEGFGGGLAGGFKKPFQKKSFGDRGDKPAMMHKATCSECGKPCEVPFKPTGDKPVYCKDCFNAKRDSTDRRGGPRPDFGNRDRQGDFSNKPTFRPEPRTGFKPAGGNDDTKRQLSEISSKLDRLVSIMEKFAGVKEEQPAIKPDEAHPSKMETKAETPAKKKVVTKKKK